MIPAALRQSVALRTTPLIGPIGTGTLIEALPAESSPAVLESSALHPEFGRYSLFACHPLAVVEVREGVLRDETGAVLARGREIWDALDELLTALSPTGAFPAVPYAPGWIGYIGYEMGRTIERLPGRAPRTGDWPDLRLALYDALLVFDALENRWTLLELLFSRPPADAGQGAEALRQGLVLAAQGENFPPAPAENAAAGPHDADESLPVQPDFSPEEYRRAVARCVEYIAAGDIFQVNLSQRFVLPGSYDPLQLYRHLRQRNPSWYAAYLRFASAGRDFAVLSSSPELFLRCRDGWVTTRPIKGTRPRVGQAEQDAAAATGLLRDEKDNAELAMIIDLLRNDLGRVCRYGTVRVREPRRLETHPTVFHLVGTVVGRLRPEVGPGGLLRATFPGGSITGAPKIRAMEIIDELEPVARGVYTGCIGIAGVHGAAEWNIAIRTILCREGQAHFHVGGGIVADSTPDGEYRETLDKARALLEAAAATRRSVETLPR